MKNKQTIRNITQTILVMITTFTILEFYENDFPFVIKWIVTIFLIALNVVYSHWCGLKNGVQMYKEVEEQMRKFNER